MNKRTKMFFLLSVALNVAFAGLLLGATCHHFLWSHSRHFSSEMLAQLPEEKRKLFEDTMHTSWEGMENIRNQLSDAKKEGARLLAADPLNDEAYLTQMQHVSDLQEQIKRHMSETVVGIAHRFTPQERAVLADITSHPQGEKH